jgi:chaperonin GroES
MGATMFDTFKPLGDRVLVKRLEGKEKTAGGIYIPDAAKEKAQIGEVLAVGPGAKADKEGNLIKPAVKVGDKVYFGKYAGTEVLGQDTLVIREEEILGIIG